MATCLHLNQNKTRYKIPSRNLYSKQTRLVNKPISKQSRSTFGASLDSRELAFCFLSRQRRHSQIVFRAWVLGTRMLSRVINGLQDSNVNFDGDHAFMLLYFEKGLPFGPEEKRVPTLVLR